MLEHWSPEVDKRQVFGALLTGLSKASECLSHELITAKLNAYGFSLSALKFIHNYLSKKQQKTKINQSYSRWKNTLFRMPQDSMQGPILFNIFISDLFLAVKEVNFTCYADDNTIYQLGKTVDDIRKSFQVVF